MRAFGSPRLSISYRSHFKNRLTKTQGADQNAHVLSRMRTLTSCRILKSGSMGVWASQTVDEPPYQPSGAANRQGTLSRCVRDVPLFCLLAHFHRWPGQGRIRRCFVDTVSHLVCAARSLCAQPR